MCNNRPLFDETIELADNAMLKHRPDLFNEWDFEKNDELGLDIYRVTQGMGRISWWLCPKCKSRYDMLIISRTKEKGCPYCSGRRVNHTNSLATLKPELIKEWSYKLNKDIDPKEVTCGSQKRVWWICNKCESEYDMSIKNRVSHDQSCPYCSSKRINHTNSLTSLNPTLAAEWHPTLNGELTPEGVTCGSGKAVWWLGKCEHEWKMRIVDRNTNNQNCPYCAKTNAKTLVGFNDVWTTNPKLASLLADPEDGYKYTQLSEKKVDWKCPECTHIVKSKSIYMIKANGVSCPKCSDGRSYPEKLMYNLLSDLMVDFEPERTFEWLPNKRYDFYLPLNNTIIEIHGEQHYNRISGMFNSNTTLEDEIANDLLKCNSALDNGIENYIVIDARKSDISFISESLRNSTLFDILNVDVNSINWNEYDKSSLHSLVKIAADLWNEGLYLKEIEKRLKVSNVTVNKYLKKAHNAGLCIYKRDRSRNAPNLTLRKKIVQLGLDGSYIKEWESIKSAGHSFGAKTGDTITLCLKGKYKTAYGFKWMYFDDYYNKEVE